MTRRDGSSFPTKGMLIKVHAPGRHRPSVEVHGVLWVVEGPGILPGNIHAKSLATGVTQFWRHNEYEIAQYPTDPGQPAGLVPGEGHADPDTLRSAKAGRKG